MKLLLGTVGTSKVDMNNAIDFLSTVQRKERSASYRQSDYLGLKRRKIVPTHRDDERVRSACSYYQKVGHWEISIEGRIQVGQWFYKMTSCFNFPNNFAVIAMDYFDRVLSRTNPLPNTKTEIQLLALSCFYLSVKLFQTGPILSTEQICMISGFVFVPSQIVEMEQKILRQLDWSLYPPTALEFLEPYLQIILCCTNSPLQFYASEILVTAEEFINEVTLDYYFIANQFLPSHIAVAALVNAIFTILPSNNQTLTIHNVTRLLSQICNYRIDEQDVILCCERLLRLMNTSYEQNMDQSMSDPYYSPSPIHHDQYHTGNATPNSPVAVTSYETDFKCHAHASHLMCGSIPPMTSHKNSSITFTRDYS